MKQVILPNGTEILQGLRLLARGLRRGIVATIAAIALLVAYGISSIGTHVVTTVGIAGFTLATTADPAEAKRGRYRGRARGRRRGRRGRRGRRRRRRGGGCVSIGGVWVCW